jgi:hypothetical protein
MSNVAVLKSGESPAARAARHLAEAKLAADQQIELMLSEMTVLRGVAQEIAEGGPVYPAGVRDLCERFLTEIDTKAKTVGAVVQKQD